MPLTLVAGPANSAKAGEVLGGLRARLDAEPILVVPAFADVEHAERELAERGAVFGARVLRFDRLFDEVAARVDLSEQVASELQRELLVEGAVQRARLEVLAASSRQPGFVRAAARFVAELQRSRVKPARLTQALRQWAGDGPRSAYADEVAAIYSGYVRGLEAAGMADRELHAWRALDELRREPRRWGTTPLFVYGFDDFTGLELDALETIARHSEAEVTVSLPFEPGRPAFKAVAGVHEKLAAIATRRLDLPALDDHYAEAARADLHHLERGLFEPQAPARRRAGGAVRLHEAGGERAEVELVAAEVLERVREGVEPGQIAVVFRDPPSYASLVEQVFGAYGIPYSIDLSVPLAHTGLGRGLLALLRASEPEGSAEDLLAYLRTPGLLEQPALADRLEAGVRRAGIESAARARELWEEKRRPLGELDELAGASGIAAYLSVVRRRLERLFAGPYRRAAPVLRGPELEGPRAFRAAHDAMHELAGLPAAHAGALERGRVHDVLAALRVRVGEDPQPDRVQVASPEAIRARRFEVVFACGLQEGELPRGSAPDPFLPDEDRRSIAGKSGLVLPMREDELERERYLFYVCCSRAERLLVLSSRVCNEEGDPQARSFFLDDVEELFDDLETRTRKLSEVTWPVGKAPTVAEWERAQALADPRLEERVPGPLTAAPVLEELAAREVVSAGALERFADCPVKWLVESLLRPVALEPDPEAMVRGSYAHAVLEATLRKLKEQTGERRVTPGNLADAERILLAELRDQRAGFSLSPKRARVRAAVRRLEFDLLRHLRAEAESDSLFEPAHLELEFDDVRLGDVRLRGKIDRVDTWDGHALVRDYKSGKSADAYKVSSWDSENRFQAALYMLAARELLELEPAGGVYVPLGGDERRPRGMVARDVPQLGSGFFDNDRLAPQDFEEKLDWARERITETAGRMRRGELGCSPESCAWNGGCAYPSICRSEP